MTLNDKNTVLGNLDNIASTVLADLKDFQRATVERIYEQFANKVNRILVADEVGLGKTLVARGVIAKFAQLRRAEGDDLVKVVYICSNTAIAGQNLEKLSIDEKIVPARADESRLSMQHLNIFKNDIETKEKNNYIQLIPLTPDTSFRMTSGTGLASERALMYVLLKDFPELRYQNGGLKRLFAGSASFNTMEWWIEHYGGYFGKTGEVDKWDKASGGEYKKFMHAKLREYLSASVDSEGVSLFDKLAEAAYRLRVMAQPVTKEDKAIIGSLRVIFAQISLEKLEPDLVIMDEFQRFQYLINSENDTDSELGMLTNKFLRSEADDEKAPRVLLLSATPFKMYSTLEEIDEASSDESYKEYLNVMSFLNRNDNSFKTVWADYTHILKEAQIDGFTTLIASKQKAETAMYNNVCRTERISANLVADDKVMDDLIDASDVKNYLKVSEADIASYMEARKAIDLGIKNMDSPLNLSVPIDYIKSTPYLFSFMSNHYVFKRKFEACFKKSSRNLFKMNRPYLWIKRKDIAFYNRIPFNNARLERVSQKVFQTGILGDDEVQKSKFRAELLLWIPPTLPYYPGEGVYKNADNFTKTLIFSSWEMVPKMLACMLSYEAERKTIGALDDMIALRNGPAKDRVDKSPYFDPKKLFTGSPLRFEFKNGRVSGNNIFCLLYPSEFLAKIYDPVECFNAGMTLKQIRASIKEKILAYLQGSIFREIIAGLNKNAFYLAVMLLDNQTYVDTWLTAMLENDIAEQEGDDQAEEKDKQNAFEKAIEVLSDTYDENVKKPCSKGFVYTPDEELLDVLTDMAIASPAVCAYRTYQMYKEKYNCEYYPEMPTEFARKFINKMNIPECRAVLELAVGKKSTETRWRDLLTYCVHGNFQAMFDEYVHIISTTKKKDKALVSNIHNTVVDSMVIRSARYKIDTFKRFERQVQAKGKNAQDTAEEEATSAIRTNFAVAFTQGIGTKDTDRKTRMRNAFNSPFRPFVLASTSIGQEGLDFHNYCRRIVHWNLPSNPIDIEQREGRINRFECLAIRTNVANDYVQNKAFYGNFKMDVWQEMFDKAKKQAKEQIPHCSDMLPFWGVRNGKAAVKIERIVPMYPYSKDVLKYNRMINILTLYRLALGQPRQEELLEHFFSQIENEEQKQELQKIFFNLSPFYRKN